MLEQEVGHMIVVIFESRPKPGKAQTYLDMGEALHAAFGDRCPRLQDLGA
jgi:hypothetical protein